MDHEASKTTIGDKVKKAGQMAAKQAQKTKLTQIILPSAYQALGKDCYSNGRFRDEFGNLFIQLDGLVNKIKALKEPAPSGPQPAAQGFAEKAKAAAGKVKEIAQEKAFSLQANSALRQLGQAIYERHGVQSGPPVLMQPITDGLTRIAELDAENSQIAASSFGVTPQLKGTVPQSSKSGWYSVPALLGMTLFCFPVGFYFVWKHPTWTTGKKAIWTGTYLMLLLVGVLSPKDKESKGPHGTDEPIVKWPTGLTEGVGARVGPFFSKNELREIAGKFVQNEIKPGWTLQRVIDTLGKPTWISRTNGFVGQSQEQIQGFLNDPLIPPSSKAQMSQVTEICTWSLSGDPGNKFIILGFTEGRLMDSESGGIAIRLP